MNNVSSQTFFIRAVTSPTLRPFTEPPSVSSCLSCQECTTGPNITDVSYQNWIRKNLLPYFGGKNLSSVDQRAIVFTAGVLCSVGRDTTHRSFSAELLSHWLAPSMPLEPFNSYARNWHFPVLLVFWQSLLHSVRFLWMAGKTSAMSTKHSNFVSHINLLWVHSVSSFRSLTNI